VNYLPPILPLHSQVTTEQELREREAELEAQNERLEQFASMVSHDLRNPLSVASGNLELYRETGEESRLETIDTALTRIQELITDLTSLARYGIPDENHELVSVSEVARDAWELIDTRSATLSTEPCTVTGDASQITTLFENLFRNAVGHGGPDVTVRVGPLENGFYVEDTGDGIPLTVTNVTPCLITVIRQATAEAVSDSQLSLTNCPSSQLRDVTPPETARKAAHGSSSERHVQMIRITKRTVLTNPLSRIW